MLFGAKLLSGKRKLGFFSFVALVASLLLEVGGLAVHELHVFILELGPGDVTRFTRGLLCGELVAEVTEPANAVVHFHVDLLIIGVTGVAGQRLPAVLKAEVFLVSEDEALVVNFLLLQSLFLVAFRGETASVVDLSLIHI